MNLKWRVAILLLTLAWWGLSPAAAAKIERFQDAQGTLHISNVKPEEPGKETGSLPAAAPLIKPQVPQAQPQPIPPPAVEPVPGTHREDPAPPDAPPSGASPGLEAQPEKQPQSDPEKPVSRSRRNQGRLAGGPDKSGIPVRPEPAPR